jgi:predicted nucleic acid-binding protein
MEKETRRILEGAVGPAMPATDNVAGRLIDAIGGVELKPLPRGSARDIPVLMRRTRSDRGGQLAGRRVQIMDGLIAGIVRANKFALATRDVARFANCGTEIIGPWNR